MTNIESSYVAQGYVLPDGLTWEAVAASRAEYGISDIYVPVGQGDGTRAWGVPIINGAFLRHVAA